MPNPALRLGSALLAQGFQRKKNGTKSDMQSDPDKASFDAAQAMAEALAHHQQGRLSEAEAIYTEILGRQPRHPDALNLLGVIAAQRGRLDSAGDLVEAAVAEQPDNPEYLFNLAHLAELKEDPEVARAYRRVLEADPNHLPALVNLGNHLLADEDYGEAAEIFRRAVGAGPQVHLTHEGLGCALQGLSRNSEALIAFEQALALNPDSGEALANLGGLYLEAGRAQEAVAHLRRAMTVKTDSTDLRANLGIALFTAGDLQGALDTLNAARRLDPRSVRATGALAFVLAELGQGEAAPALSDYEGLLQERRFTAVPGFGSLSDFNAALVQRVLAHPTLVENRPSKTTRGGSQTGELAGDDDPAIQALEETIREVAASYLAQAAAISADPYFTPPPEAWRLTLWGTVLNAGGHQAPHNHPGGLVSGVYYPQLPDCVSDGESQEGWIEFGRPPVHFDIKAEPRLKLIRPQVGSLLLFPSFFWHRTIPFDSDRQRISIAFDLVPES